MATLAENTLSLAKTHYEMFQERVMKANPGMPFRSWDESDEPVRQLYIDSAQATLVKMAERAATPAATWRENGEPDPHGDRYNCERVALCGGHMTDDWLANEVFMDPSIGNLTSAKDRIRWLSRQLVAAVKREEHYNSCLMKALHANSELQHALRDAGHWLPIETYTPGTKAVLIAGGTYSVSGGSMFQDERFLGVTMAALYGGEWVGDNVGAHDVYYIHKPTHWREVPVFTPPAEIPA